MAIGGAGSGILQLSIKDKAVLHAAYMPFLENGGLFVPTRAITTKASPRLNSGPSLSSRMATLKSATTSAPTTREQKTFMSVIKAGWLILKLHKNTKQFMSQCQ